MSNIETLKQSIKTRNVGPRSARPKAGRKRVYIPASLLKLMNNITPQDVDGRYMVECYPQPPKGIGKADQDFAVHIIKAIPDKAKCREFMQHIRECEYSVSEYKLRRVLEYRVAAKRVLEAAGRGHEIEALTQTGEDPQ